MGMPQHLVLVLDGFHAMSICNEIVEDREAVTSLIRKRLSEQMCLQVFSDVEWLRVEQKVWEFLVHKEFEVRRLAYFKCSQQPYLAGLLCCCQHMLPALWGTWRCFARPSLSLVQPSL
jgi:hypothetical protein